MLIPGVTDLLCSTTWNDPFVFAMKAIVDSLLGFRGLLGLSLRVFCFVSFRRNRLLILLRVNFVVIGFKPLFAFVSKGVYCLFFPGYVHSLLFV